MCRQIQDQIEHHTAILAQVEAIVKESKQADELNKRLAELVAKDWTEITLASLEQTGSLGEDVETNCQNGRRAATSSLQPNCFHNLSHCSPSSLSSTTATGQDAWTSKEVELEERLDNDDIKMGDNSTELKEIESKRRLASSAEVDQARKRRKEESLNREAAKPRETFSQDEAEKVLLSIVGAGDSENVLKLVSSLAESFEFRSSSTNGSRCSIPKDSLLELASLEESFVDMKRVYPSPYSGSRGSGVVELRRETASVEEEEQQREEARLKEQLAKDGDLEKYLREKEKLKQKNRQADWMDLSHVEGGAGGGSEEEEEDQREEARLKEQLARDCDLERFQRERRKFLELKQKRKEGTEVCSPLKNVVAVELKGVKVESQSKLTEMEKVQKELASAKDKLSKEKDVEEYKREKKIIFRGALDRLRKQLLKDGNMKNYLAQKKMIDGISH